MSGKYWVANNPSSSVTSAQAQIIAGLGDVTASAAEINAGVDGLTATAVEINNKCDGAKTYVSTGSTAAYDILAANTGNLHTLTAIGANQTIDLPTEADGLNYKIVYFGGAEEGQNFIIDSEANGNFFIGGVVHQDLDGDVVGTVYSNGSTNSILTLITPGAGTEINLLCDGTNWYIWGNVVSATAPTMAAQS
jgi:hypothetical protein